MPVREMAGVHAGNHVLHPNHKQRTNSLVLTYEHGKIIPGKFGSTGKAALYQNQGPIEQKICPTLFPADLPKQKYS